MDPRVAQREVRYVRMDNIPMADALLSIADMLGDVAFVIRPGYIFATTRDTAQTIHAPSIPDYLPLYMTPEVATQVRPKPAPKKASPEPVAPPKGKGPNVVPPKPKPAPENPF